MPENLEEEWRDLANAAEVLLSLQRAQNAGLFTVQYGELKINRRICEHVLRRAQGMGIFPDVLEARAAALQR